MTNEHRVRRLELEKQGLELRIEVINDELKNYEPRLPYNFKEELGKEILACFISDIKNLPREYVTSEGIKQKSAKEEMDELLKSVNIIPIDSSMANIEDKSILVLDVNYLPSEFKGNTSAELSEYLQSIYGYKVLLIDGSRQNLQGSLSAQYKPAYFI